MKSHQPKLKTQLFSCGFFRHCTQTVISPTTPHPPPLPLSSSGPLPPPPPPSIPPHRSDPSTRRNPQPESESSSSSTSQSFTQWRFPLPNSPIRSFHPEPEPEADSPPPEATLPSDPPPLPLPISSTNLQELFHVAELQLSAGSESDQIAALHQLERSLVPNPPTEPECPPELMRGVVGSLKSKPGAKPASKILLALCLAEGNRRVAVEAGAVATVIESAPELEGAAAERSLAALELMCTVAEGVAAVRAHALAVPVMVATMGRTSAREKEYAISVLAVIYGGASETSEGEAEAATAPPEEVARAVALALQGDCSARGRRKGVQLLKTLQDNNSPSTVA
ncbi:Armadillo-like helical [Parasponia andersonii]|uniref:Armadillo-like helical n=1 Tax=Parasponia andersonii TaxID=3476 RepID=A0A2P5AL55_PARAD|nr:Armadillo-like helical [Parasponia andersonii]